MKTALQLSQMQLNKEVDSGKREDFDTADLLEYGFKILGYQNKLEKQKEKIKKRWK